MSWGGGWVTIRQKGKKTKRQKRQKRQKRLQKIQKNKNKTKNLAGGPKGAIGPCSSSLYININYKIYSILCNYY